MKMSLTLFVRERISTVRIFLESLNKNSFYEGHEVLWCADPEWEHPSDPDFAEYEGNISMKEWLTLHEADFPRVKIRVVEGWSVGSWGRIGSTEGITDRPPMKRRSSGWHTPVDDSIGRRIDSGRAFNVAIREHLRTDYVVTSMACDMYWAPNWDLNALKWAGCADLIVPKYCELHLDMSEDRREFYRDGCTDYYYFDNKLQSTGELLESDILDCLEHGSLVPSHAIYESPAHRVWTHSIAVILTKETFNKARGFWEIPHPQSTDLYFDDDCGRAGLLKIIPLDSFAVHGTLYLRRRLKLDPTIQGGPTGRWYFPEKLRTARSTVNETTMTKWDLRSQPVMIRPSMGLSNPLNSFPTTKDPQ
jgi:hypothetical protein